MAYKFEKDRKEYARKYRIKNRERRTAYTRQWRLDHLKQTKENEQRYYLENREKIKRRGQLYSSENRNKRNKIQRKYRHENRELLNKKERQYAAQRYRLDPNYRMTVLIRCRINEILRGFSKAAPSLKLLGCTIPELWEHLETNFRPGMTRKNRGPIWHVDHIRPCASFDLTDPAQQRECFNYKNLQPLFAFDNLSKGAKHNRE